MGSAVGSTHCAAQLLQFVVEALGLDEKTKISLSAQAQAAFQGLPRVVPQPPGLGQQAAAAATAPSGQAAAELAATALQQATEAAAAAYHKAAAENAAAKAAAAVQNQAAVQAAADQHQAEVLAAAAVPLTRQGPPGRAAPGTPVGQLLDAASGSGRERSKTPPSMQTNRIGC